MADGRMIRKKISLNEALADMKDDTHRLLFTWAIPHLDIEGRMSASPRVFKATVVPLIDTISLKKIREFFQDAHSLGLIAVYEMDDEWVLEFPKFKENQNLRESREAPSKFPPPPEDVWNTPGVIPELSSRTPAEVNRREVKRREVNMVLDEKFEMFWRAYPKKKAKPDALAAWKKSNGKPSIEKILAALEKQKRSDDWTKENGQYIPYPASWINKGRWDDEVEINVPTQFSGPCPTCKCKPCICGRI